MLGFSIYTDDEYVNKFKIIWDYKIIETRKQALRMDFGCLQYVGGRKQVWFKFMGEG